ncbi:esterase/lipase family protein [Geodermatophilus sp. SYSU D00742]
MRTLVLKELVALASAAVVAPFGFTTARDADLARLLAVTAADLPADRAPATPVVLVHGYGGNRSNWLSLEVALGRAGFANVYATRYNPLTTDLPAIAGRLVRECHAAMRDTGSGRVHVVGHSLGGVVLRYAATRLGLAAWLDVGVTVASPHLGSAVARLGRGAVAADLRPGSALLREVNGAQCPHPVRWVSYWSDVDPIVRPWSALLPGPAEQVTNVLVPDEGHLSILRSPVLHADLVDRLHRAEVAARDRDGPGDPARPTAGRAVPAAA